MESTAEFGHQLLMSDSLFSGGSLSFGNPELVKEIYLRSESFIMVNAHDNQIAFTIGREIHWRILLVADRSDLPCSMADA
jgi:hypothetical protein